MNSLNEKCAVVAVSNKKAFDVARLVYLALWSLQHRGQDSSGIASFDGSQLQSHKKTGLVSRVYSPSSLARLKGRVAIGHNRYSTSGGNDSALNQPYDYHSPNFAFAHNGNLPYTDKLTDYAQRNGLDSSGLNDSGLMGLALNHELNRVKSIPEAVRRCWPLFTGAFCCVGLLNERAFAFRDSHGIRPLVLGKTDHGYIIASETVALDIIGANFIRDVRPGELIMIWEDQFESIQISEGEQVIDAFEFIYLARPDSRIANRSVYTTRYRAGQSLAKAAPVKADVVIAIPDSGIPAATGYSHQSGIPAEHGLLKNRYIGRTFIEPEKIRRNSIELKFNAIVEIVAGKDIVLVDDSIVRGNTLKHVIGLLRSYGAKQIHVRIASPPILHPDFYGIDTPDGNDLIASRYDVTDIGRQVGADSLVYLPLSDLVSAIGLSQSQLCLSSFDGRYPIEVPY